MEKIVNVSELSTFTAVYNGIAQVPEENAPENTAYYVSYEVKVNAGVDFEKIGFSVDDEEKIIRAALPKVDIIDVNIDIASMDYIFVNRKMNASTVSQEAYKACETDARSECEQEAAIFNLARQNVENIVTALIEPFVKQLDAGYKIVDQGSASISAEDETAAFAATQSKMEEAAASNRTLLNSAQQRAQALLENYVKNIGAAVGREYSVRWVNVD